MRYVYREVDGRVQAVLVSSKPRLRNDNTTDLYGEHVPFHQSILNAYKELESKGDLDKGCQCRDLKTRAYVRDVHQRALDEGF